MIPVGTGQLVAATQSHKQPIFKLEYYDTPYGVPTLGYTVEYYNDPTNQSDFGFPSGNIAMRGKNNIMSYNWGLGAPPGVQSTNYFKGRYYGYFYAEFTGEYTFFISKEPTDYVRLYIDSTRVATPQDSGSYPADTLIDEWGYNGNSAFKGVETVSGDITLTAGNWYPMMVEFAEREKQAYLVCRYREPDGVTNANGDYSDYDSQGVGHSEPVEHRKVLSAGVFANRDSWADADDAEFISATIISGATSISFNQESNQSNVLDFTAPILEGYTTSGLKGFRYDSVNDLYIDDNTGMLLRQGRLIRYSAGYASTIDSPVDADYVQRFEGVITDIDVDKDRNGRKLKVKCQDLLYFAIDAINENYPDVTSYVTFDFVDNNTANAPAGLTRPTAYDAWPLEDVVRDLLVKSKIDPTKLYGRKRFLSVTPDDVGLSDSTTSTKVGDYFIDTKDILLRRKIKYGNPALVGAEQDDEYIWAPNFGEHIYEILTKLSDAYGFDLGMNHSGYAIFSSVNSPQVITGGHHSWSFFGGTWQQHIDIAGDGGKYYSQNQPGRKLIATITGAEFAVNFVKENAEWNNNMVSGWNILDHELPQNAIYDPTQTEPKYGIMYGRVPYFNPLRLNYITFNYPVTTYYIRPDKDMTVQEIQLRHGVPDLPSIWEDNDLNLELDIYVGRVVGGDYENLVGSSQILDGFTRPNRLGDRWVIIDASDGLSEFDIEDGNIYGIRFVSKEKSGTLPQNWGDETPGEEYYRFPNLYTTEHMAIESVPTNAIHAAWWYNQIDPSDMSESRGTIRYDTTNSNKQVYPNIRLLGEDLNLGQQTEYSRCEVRVYPYLTNESTYATTAVFVRTVDNMYYDKTGSTEQLRFPSDGKDYTGENPCRFVIKSEDIGLTTSGDIKGAYNKYRIEILNSSAGEVTRVTSIEAFDEGQHGPTWRFDTSDNIASLGIDESMDDSRNDVLVVGDFLGKARDRITKEVINANNPATEYVYSRATDISSINDPNAKYNIGRKKPFLIFEPELIDQRHADWLAQEVLTRYHTFRRAPEWKAWGVPFVEVGDNIAIGDRTGGGDISHSEFNNSQWLISIDEKISLNDYSMNFQTTPYEPWASFTPNPPPDINDFGGMPFINVRMTDSEGSLRGYDEVEVPPGHARFDVYENESGNRLMLKYDQVIDGDVVIKVVSKSVLGDLHTRNVAYLVGGIDSDGNEVPEYREWGKNYVLFWDGVDEFGDVRRRLGQNVNVEDGELIANIEDVDFVASYDQPGFYAPSGDYFIKFTVFPKDRNLSAKSVDTLNLLTEFNQEIHDTLNPSDTSERYEQTWRIEWGDLPDLTMSVSGQRPAQSERDITYYPNHYFYSDENTNNGALFKFTFDPDLNIKNKKLYYKVDIHHYWGVGYTFLLREDRILQTHLYNDSDLTEDWKVAFEYGLQEMYNAKFQRDGDVWAYLFGSYLYRDIVSTPTVPDESFPANPDRAFRHNTYSIHGWNILDNNPLMAEHRLEQDYYAYIDSDISDPNRYRVIAWKDVPYTHYVVKDFVPQTTHAYSNDNIIQFYFNPTSPRAGGWTFDGLPDMTQAQYDFLRLHMALGAYYAGPFGNSDPNSRLNLCTTHMFQLNTLIWDATGRLVKTTDQLIAAPAPDHEHLIWSSNPVGGNTGPHNHDNGDLLTLQPKKWRQQKNHGSVEIKNQMFIMETPGGTDNYGIGYCNITGMPNYGFWTWHGHWRDDGFTRLDYSRLGFNHTNPPLEGTLHWMTYKNDNPGPHTENEPSRTFVPHWHKNENQIWYDLRLGTNHGHHPIYEGINYFDLASNQAYDQHAIIDTAIDSFDVTFNNLDENLNLGIFWDESETTANSWREPKYNRLQAEAGNPQKWYIMEIELPWGTNDGWGEGNYWANFLYATGYDDATGRIYPGLEFFHGGWAQHMKDKEEEEI